jgi:type VI secretion system protein VasI
VKWRVDAQPVAVEWWTPSVNGQAVFSPAAIPFLKKLIDGRELVLSVGAYNKLPESLSFPISSAESAIRPIREACKW